MRLKGAYLEGNCFHCGHHIPVIDVFNEMPPGDDPQTSPVKPFEEDGLLWVRCPKCGKSCVIDEVSPSE